MMQAVSTAVDAGNAAWYTCYTCHISCHAFAWQTPLPCPDIYSMKCRQKGKQAGYLKSERWLLASALRTISFLSPNVESSNGLLILREMSHHRSRQKQNHKVTLVSLFVLFISD